MKHLEELQNLTGKTALVTGGAGYLGKAICESLAELGANVIVASRNMDKCIAFAQQLVEKFATNCIGIECDITDESSLESARDKIKEKFGHLDILVNNAWSGRKNSFESITTTDWLYDIDVCLNGPFLTTKAFSDMLKESKGVILNVASMYGVVAPDYKLYEGNDYANPPSYGAAKAGIVQFTKYLASFLAKHSIRVNAISPGPFPFKETISENQEFIERLKRKNMLGRIGEPEDLKGVIAFLCSDASSYVTGQNISIDGGWTAC
jgi:NAD(P)-dependent dehydrogenase (short-subunit alcohol dehydrogenase family)